MMVAIKHLGWLLTVLAAVESQGTGQPPAAPATLAVLPAHIRPQAVPPGATVTVTYRWRAERPPEAGWRVFVHLVDGHDRITAQDDHDLPKVLAESAGRDLVQYSRRIVLAPSLTAGTYRLLVGLYRDGQRAVLGTAATVASLAGRRYQVGALIVDPGAPWPPADTQGEATLDLSGCECVFAEEFDGPLDVSAWGSGTRWIAHTPWAGDFGAARFVDPGPDGPFRVRDGHLIIEARRDPNGHWTSGLLASNDPSGAGFALRYGYFEIRCRLPAGSGVWPAFWLCSSYDRHDPNAGEDGSIEIDVFEYYGHQPHSFWATVHQWQPEPHRATGWPVTTPPHAATEAFHRYGCLVDPDWVRFFVDGVEVWRTPTPSAHNKPLMILLNLALGGGWPIDETPSPSVMEVDYVRVYRRAGGAKP